MNDIEKYFEKIEKEVTRLYKVAEKARAKGFDPKDKPEIPIAKNMAERVVGLISTVSPQIINTKIPERIQELEKEYGALDWRVALTIAEEVAMEKFCKFKDKLEAMEIGIRTGFAYITLGTVASPLEGFAGIKIKQRSDGKEYFSLQYSGPIRSAGGTGASVSVLIADHIRQKFGYDVYDPTEKEIKRTITELYDYHDRITNLQYLPSEEEIEFMAKNTPVQIDGDPSEQIEVSNYKDNPRIETNRIRNGVCLVMGECLCQKSPKLWKQLSNWGHDFNLDHWNFLEEFLTIQKKAKAKGQDKKEEKGLTPNYTFIKDIVAGRPVLTHPLATGGFRLRYGRARTTGYSAAAIHPSTTHILRDYIGVGTQLKLERPGKAASMTTCDTIEPPIVKISDGSVIKVDTVQKAKELSKKTTEILFLGDVLFNYGDFFNRAHPLVPAGYCEEYWALELEKAAQEPFMENLKPLIQDPLRNKPTIDGAISLSKQFNIPLHPKYTYYWKTISHEQLTLLLDWLSKSKNQEEKLILSLEQEPKRVLEELGIPHLVVNNEFVVIDKQESKALDVTLNLSNIENTKDIILNPENTQAPALDLINKISEITIKDKAGVFVGARMGRPEKAKMRKLAGSPHVLFPVGEQGGKMRSFQSALERGNITAEFANFTCTECKKQTIFSVCQYCNKPTKPSYYCPTCGIIEEAECRHGPARSYTKQDINIKEIFNNALKKIHLNVYPDLIKGVKGTSNRGHVPEHIIKGILRAKNDIHVNKDGTTRYDMTQLPITHFKQKEIGTSIEKLKELGYMEDIKGNPLNDENQILELLPQDVILPACLDSPDEGADKILFRTAKFIDELLQKLYNRKSRYNLTSEADLAGQLVVALAPHTSAGIVGRIVGFSRTQGFFAHPMLHAATLISQGCLNSSQA